MEWTFEDLQDEIWKEVFPNHASHWRRAKIFSRSQISCAYFHIEHRQ